MIKQLIALIFALLGCTSISHAQLHINEWMASNSSVISDPDFDETADWIELYNSGDSEIELEGYFLTDNLGNPAKWQLPSVNIGPKEHLLIWADSENQGVHTNFKLTKDGEVIGLYDADTTQLDQVEFQHQKTNISMGRRSDGGAELGFFSIPTPGTANAQLSYAQITYYEPSFSKRGGFYSEPIEVAINSIAGKIYYTLDGSLPQTDDLLYTAPLSISSTTILRAAVISSDQLPGKAVTQSYFFDDSFEDRGLPVVSIVSEPDYFWDEDIGLYVQDFKPEWRYPINIELFENDGSNRAAFNELAATKVNGLNSWVLPQKMLGIYFDNDYDKNNLDYQLFFDRERKQYDNFILRASGNDWSHTLFRDALAQGLTAENMDIERMGYRPAIAFINGEYMGIHNLRSRIDESFIEDNFGYAKSEYDLIENDGVPEEGDDLAYSELRALFDLDLSDEDNYRMLTEVVDIRNFMDYFITEIWCSNSSYGHNIQLWKPKAAGSKWRWIFTDLDRGFAGSERYGLEYFTDKGPNYYEFARVILTSVLENETFRAAFTSRFADHLYTTYNPVTVIKTIDEFANSLAPEMPYHVTKWQGTESNYGDGISTVSFWENAVSDLKQFAREREGFIIGELMEAYGLSDPAALSVQSNPSNAGSIIINEITLPESPWRGPYFKAMPFELTAIPKEGYTFKGWSPGKKEIVIPKGATWFYLDDGTDQGKAWTDLGYNASNWKISKAQFGYGDNDEVTVVDYGPDSDDKHITTYFRRFVEIDKAASQPSSLDFQILRDDGAVVYLNGKEIHRTNMPNGDISYSTTAASATASPSESTFYNFSVGSEDLLDGTNVIAVEVHQVGGTSSDISFDLEMSMNVVGGNSYVSTDETITVELSRDSVLIANYESLDFCSLGGVIDMDTRLTIDCSPYVVLEDVVVSEGVNLAIDPGVELHFENSKDLLINGSLAVEGTEAEPVIFKTASRTDAWGGLIFRNSTGTSRVSWLELSEATRGDHPIYENAAISVFHATVELDHLTIDEVYSNPILGYYSDIQLQNSYLHSAVTGDLINIKYGKGLVHNCEFRGNNQVDTDAIDYDEVEGGVISNNKIYDFLGFNSDGIDLGEESKDVLVKNNFIYNCTDKAISVGQQSTVTLEHNIIVNCNQGVALKDLSQASINFNTFYNVGIPIACFEKTVGIGGGTGIASNCILSNSPVATYLVDAHSALDLENMLSDTDTLLVSEGIWGHPHFEDPSHFDFRLQADSDAKDAGVDASGMVVDLGSAYHEYTAEPTIMITAINYNPLDNADAEFIDLYNPSSERIDLTGYVLSGAVDMIFPSLAIKRKETIRLVKDASLFPPAGKQIVPWQAGKLSNGGELIRLTDPNGIIIDQVIYNDKEPWPTAADGEGSFLRLASPQLDNHFAESWVAGDKTAVSETNMDNSYQLAPNPAIDWLTLSSESKDLKTVSILDRNGQLIQELNPQVNRNVKIEIQDLTVGLYYLHINGEVALPFIKIR